MRTQREFQALSRRGRRAAADGLWCRYLDDASVVPPRVGYSVGRAIGSAVARNRVRRRLRHVVRARVADGDLTHGSLLVGTSPDVTERTYVELQAAMGVLLSQVRR